MKNISKTRTIVFYSTSTVMTLLLGIVSLPALLSRDSTNKLAKFWVGVLLALLRIICKINFKVVGMEHMPRAPFIVACKHQSAMETLILPLILPRPVFIIKKEMLYLPLVGSYLKSSGAIYIDRSKGKDAILHIQEQLTRLSRRDSLAIFPEGTRTSAGIRTEKYRSGIAMIYEQLRWPVLPIAVNTGAFWPKRGPMRAGTATIKILPVISPKKYDRKQFLESLNETIENKSMELYKTNKSNN